MTRWFRDRYLDLLGSIYIYNEHRGYTALDRVLGAVRHHRPGETDFIAAIEKHRGDERKHYLMFKRWFERRGVMPYAVDRTCGHIDRFVEIMFGSSIDGLDTEVMMERGEMFARLCRVISLTERRGYRQIGILLRHRPVRDDDVLTRIFKIIEKDEPSHWRPYEEWLERHGGRPPKWWERLIDGFIHSELMVLKVPLLFFMPRLSRRTEWPDAAEALPLNPGPTLAAARRMRVAVPRPLTLGH